MPTNLPWRRWTRGCLLAAIVGLAFWLRIGQATESLWLDELHTSWVVADGAQQLVPRAGVGNYSPAYFGLVWAVTKCVGTSELTLRLPSVLAGTALVVGACLVVVRGTGSWPAGLLAALLVAVDRHCVFYGQEARPYALVQLVGLIHIAIFGRLVWSPRTAWRAAWIATGLALFYLHYTAVLLVAAEAVFYGAVQGLGLGHSGLYRWRQFAADWIILGLGLLPAVPHLREIAQRRQAWSTFVRPRAWWRLWEMADVFPLDVYVLWPLVILALAWLGAWLFRRQAALATSGTGKLRWALLLLCWFLVPLAIAWTATAQGAAPLFFRRYLMVAAVAPILGAAVCCAACPSIFWRCVLAVTVIGLSLHEGGLIWQWRQDGRVIGDRNQDWHAAVRWVREQSNADAPVFVRSGLIEAEYWYRSPDPLRRDYCLLPVLGLYRLEQLREDLVPLAIRPPTVLSPAARRDVLACGQAWCLVLGDEHSVARFVQNLRSVWQRAGVSVRAVQQFPFDHVTALRVTVAAPSPPAPPAAESR